MHARGVRWLVHPWRLAELFAIVNLGALAGDVWIAHSVNSFARVQEWIPVVFSLAAPLFLSVAAVAGGLTPSDRYPLRSANAPWRDKLARGIGLLVGWISVTVGVAGMLYHLESHFFEQQTLRNLVYTAPFVAPLAYAGIGLLLILNRTVTADSLEWAQWVSILALGGFIGNFVLSVADHAQNGFFNRLEWIPVVVSATGVAFLLMAILRPADRRLAGAAKMTMALQVATGVMGFAFHITANLLAEGSGLWEKFVYGAPAFAPLLFVNLALLAAIGLWAMSRAVIGGPELGGQASNRA